MVPTSLLFLVSGLSAPIVSAALSRTKFNFNSNWRLHVGDDVDQDDVLGKDYDDSEWHEITLPHAWNEDDAFAVSIENLTTEIAYYRKTFGLPTDSADGARVFLEFEGIRHGGDFYVNGEFAGRSENGVMAFGFDVTDLLSWSTDNGTVASNVVAARIDNDWDFEEAETGTTFQWSDSNFYANYGGINKNAYLHITAGPVYQTLPLYSNLETTGVYVYATDFDIAGGSATIHAESEIRNDGDEAQRFRYNVVVSDPDGNEVASFSGDEAVDVEAGETVTVEASQATKGLEFWSWGYGYLYTVETKLISAESDSVLDTVTTTTGFRKTEFSDGEFRLNDRPLHVKGFAQRSTNEWPALGSSYPAWLSDLSNGLMVTAAGANTVRWMHVTPAKQDVESCDRVGLMQAMPAGDREEDVEGRQWEQRVELMRDAVIYNRNNPSIVWYEAGNAGISEDHMAEMVDVRDTYDPHGGRAAGSREMMNSSVAEYGGEMLYINKGSSIPFWSMEYMRDEGLRQFWDNDTAPFHLDGSSAEAEDGPAYDRNQDSYALEAAKRWSEYWTERPGTGHRVNAGGVNIVWADSNTHHRGSVTYRTSGEVDALRLPKPDALAVHRVMWAGGWVDVDEDHAAPDLHIIGHWNYDDSSNMTSKTVHVVSNATPERSVVALYLNGELVSDAPEQDLDAHGPFVFSFPDVPYAPGDLEARIYSRGSSSSSSSNPASSSSPGGTEEAAPLATDTRTTTGRAAALRLTAHYSPLTTAALTADGSDVVLVDVEVVDASGARVPTALHDIEFSLSPPDQDVVEWRGGLAAPPDPDSEVHADDNYVLSTTLPVQQGVNRVILRSAGRGKTGTVTLTAREVGGAGLAGAEVDIVAVAAESEGGGPVDGLETSLPGEGLPAYMGRGPTPTGGKEAYTRTRRALSVASAGAGSNDAEAEYAVDSDEETSWESADDAEEGDAWLALYLEQGEEVAEVTVKYADFKEAHAVKVLVGSKEEEGIDDAVVVFEGDTVGGLGYVTMLLERTVGDKVVLMSADGGGLGVMEVEVYGPL